MQDVRIIRKPRVTEITGLSPSTVRRLEMARQFPKRLKLSKSAVGWVEAEVLAWVESRKAEGAANV